MLVLGDVVRVNAGRYSNKTALIMDENAVAFLEPHRRVNLIAHSLLRRGAESGDRIVILSRNCRHRGFDHQAILPPVLATSEYSKDFPIADGVNLLKYSNGAYPSKSEITVLRAGK
jgi:acyl-CoA synthetase (AMP-forming)/AMP-acid ligase II